MQEKDCGEVKTIKNVRKYTTVKSSGDYDKDAVHQAKAYRDKRREAKKSFQSTGVGVEDGYVPGKKLYFGKSKAITDDKRAELDHVVAAKVVHETYSKDPGAVLSGCSYIELANLDENLEFTNKKLNSRKSAQITSAKLLSGFLLKVKEMWKIASWTKRLKKNCSRKTKKLKRPWKLTLLKLTTQAKNSIAIQQKPQ